MPLPQPIWTHINFNAILTITPIIPMSSNMAVPVSGEETLHCNGAPLINPISNTASNYLETA